MNPQPHPQSPENPEAPGTPRKEPLRAFSYLRISSPEQLKGDGIRRQLDATNEYCEKNGLVLETRPMTDPGLSGFHGDNISRGALGAFKEAVEKGKIPMPCALVVEKLDRISRQDIETAIALILGLISYGVEIHTVMDQQIYRKGEMDMTKFIISIVTLSRGHEESLTKSKRLTAAWLKKRELAHKKILTRVCPGWLKANDDLTGFEVIPERAALVQEIFELTAAGHNKAKIAGILNDRKEPVWDTGRKSKPVRWYDTFINNLLTGRAVLGELKTCNIVGGLRKYDLPPIQDYYPQIINQELWDKASTSNAARRRQRAYYPDPNGPRNLVPALVWINGQKAFWRNRGCRRNHVWKRPRTGKVVRYWVYYITKKTNTGKVQDSIPREFVESMILGRLVSVQPSDLTVAPVIDEKASRRSILTTRIQELETGIARMVAAIRKTALENLPESILQQIRDDERALDLAQIELRKLEASETETVQAGKAIPDSLEAIRQFALQQNDPEIREQLTRHLTNIIGRVDVATAPEHLPEWCQNGALFLAKLYQEEPEGKDAAAGWVAITLRDGTRIAGFATGDPNNPTIVTVETNPDVPKKKVQLMIGAGTVRVEQPS
jgi:DNA invertase Pin-like site-specific DNA recombinase